MRAVIPVVVLMIAVVSAASAEPVAPAEATASVNSGTTVRVTMRHNRFRPRRVVVRLGQTVRWTNRDSVAHTVASADLKLSSEAIRGGESFSYRPRRRGRFDYYCTIHANQTGVLIVR
jgi:plastocyanin